MSQEKRAAPDEIVHRSKRAQANDHATIEGKDTDSFKAISSFKDAAIDESLIAYCSKFSAPTPIQAYSWPILTQSRDLIAVAKTGSGKTIAFGIPSINFLVQKPPKKHVRILVLSPTRELCMQTFSVLSDICAACSLKAACVFGGVSKGTQRAALSEKPAVLVATPGRLNDFLESNEIDLSKVSHFILDEADRMLDMGFEPEIRKIVAQLPSKRQTLMFSATWPTSIQSIAKEFLSNPVKVVVGSNELAANTQITQTVHVLDDQSMKQPLLLDLLRKMHRPPGKTIVFVLYKAEAVRLEQSLNAASYSCVSIHGDKNQQSRTAAFEAFKSGKSTLLVATDVAARGLDIPSVECVINFTFPLTIEDYVHRIGRTGRGERTGIAHTFFTSLDKAHAGELVNILKKASQTVPEELIRFGTTVKRKEHKDYGAFYHELDPNAKSSHRKFSDDE